MITEKDITAGHVYRAKKPRAVGSLFQSYYNDRHVLWVSIDRSKLQYDSPAVPLNGKYKTVTMEQFLKWADKDVSDSIPADSWAPWGI